MTSDWIDTSHGPWLGQGMEGKAAMGGCDRAVV